MSPSTLLDVPAVETPNAVMRTYASPAVNGAPVAVWRTEMGADAGGPVHTVSETQVVVVLDGAARVTLRGDSFALEPGDSIVLPAGEERQVAAGASGAVTLTSALPGATARVGAGDPVPVPWAR